MKVVEDIIIKDVINYIFKLQGDKGYCKHERNECHEKINKRWKLGFPIFVLRMYICMKDS